MIGELFQLGYCPIFHLKETKCSSNGSNLRAIKEPREITESNSFNAAHTGNLFIAYLLLRAYITRLACC